MGVFPASGSGVVGRQVVPHLAKASSELGWSFRYPSWGQGSEEGSA
jgi:hypothetical protein